MVRRRVERVSVADKRAERGGMMAKQLWRESGPDDKIDGWLVEPLGAPRPMIRVSSSALLIEDDIEAAAERGAEAVPLEVAANMSVEGEVRRQARRREIAAAVLRAAVGEGDR